VGVVGVALSAFLVAPAGAPGGVIDILVLVALPFRRLPKMLPLEPLGRSPVFSCGSLAVAPLRPVDVGDGWTLWEEDRDGTWRSPRCFLAATGAASATGKNSFSFCAPDTAVCSDSSVRMVFGAVEVPCVEELGGWRASVAI
jgi:hypothetical protein